MKIVLYSDFCPGISDAVDLKVLDILAKTSCRIGYIPSDSDPSRKYFRRTESQFRKLGLIDVFYFDLGQEYDSRNISKLMSCDAVYLSGGDPQRFLELIESRKFSSHLKKYLASGKLIIGVSAGAMVLSSTLGLASEADDFLAAKRRIGGLKFFGFEFYPHFNTKPSQVTSLQKYAKFHGVEVYACDDSAGLYITDKNTEPLGLVTRIDSNGLISH